MLKFIQYQLLDDQDQQQELEQKVSSDISRNIKNNIAAFRDNIPNLVDIVNEHKVQQYSIFCTKSGQLNIVDFSSGRAFYGNEPQEEVALEFSQYTKKASYFSLSKKDGLPWRHKPLPAKVDVLLVFGMGLGYHLSELINGCRIKLLVIYEPNLDMLVASVQAHAWDLLLESARALDTHIFVQIGSDASSINEDLGELLQAIPELDEVFVYRHQFHPVMDDVINYLMSNSGDLHSQIKTKRYFDGYTDSSDYVPEHAKNVNSYYQEKLYNKEDGLSLFEDNMAALRSYYPEIWQSMKDYSPKRWFLVEDDDGQPNLYHKERRALFYENLEVESQEIADYFTEHPFKDDVVIGMKSTGKLYQHLHFSCVEAFSRNILDKTVVKKCKLPTKINCQMTFGMALGKHVENILSRHDVDNLFICEPNLDFFYSSLFVVDYSSIFRKTDENKSRLYLNLGGDGSTYFHDLMSQFYQVGAYKIADTYMLSGYYNQKMQRSIFELRSELKVVLALGEYYDHARFGIAHTYNSIAIGHRFMKEQGIDKTSSAFDLPVFVIGNGPSLDECLEHILQHRSKVIVVSCGTALKALHANGIKPDFHAEIEQNRATYDWVEQVNDPQYVKDIRLVSVNGIHPNTADLFKETILAFKDGEASSYIFNTQLKLDGYDCASLSYAYPTVTNLVLNYFTRWGFKYFYLFGVDLGYVDVSKHHSSHSAYYKEDGSEVYDYQGLHGGGLNVEGNFAPSVFSKPEFLVSKKLLEQAISSKNGAIEVYNCSNGVKLKGSFSLLPENILIHEIKVDKESIVSELIEQSFYILNPSVALKVFKKFDHKKIKASTQELLGILEHDVKTESDARFMLEKHWDFFRDRAILWDDMTFYIFHGSSNYFAAVMTKIAANLVGGDEDILKAFNFVVTTYKDFIIEAMARYIGGPLDFDSVTVKEMFDSSLN